MTPEAAARLLAHRWPGNVRELKSLCTRLAVLHPGAPVTPGLLPPEIAGEGEGEAPAEGLWAMERQAILKALREHGGNRSAAARALQIPRHVLLYRLKKYGIEGGGAGSPQKA
ncbi:MAG: helix-turn-helix domain-containing protein [Acidobacteriota bacterium]